MGRRTRPLGAPNRGESDIVKPTYDPSVFAVSDIDRAKRIILTPEDSNTEVRWQTETGYLADLIDNRFELNPASVVLDYGCGIGRIAKELIERTGCSVIGADISPQMRVLGPQYVQSDRFMACSPEMLDSLIWGGLKVDAALSVWVLQHCLQPAVDIARIRDAIKANGSFFLVNNWRRAVPTVEHGWFDDELDVREMVREEFDPVEEGCLAQEKTSPNISKGCYWANFRNRRTD